MACIVCNGTKLLAAGIVDEICPLCECDDEAELAEIYKEGEVADTIATKPGRASIAAQTLRVHEQGGYWFNDRCIVLEPMMRFSIDSTILYPATSARAETRADRQEELLRKTVIEVTEETTIQAGARLHAKLGAKAGRALCLLNFASAKNPGGGFQNGSLAQEESLALSSGLYACLVEHRHDFYAPHRNNPDDGLYSHAMLYSPRVPFFRDDTGDFCPMWCAGVVTSPAPNAGCARRKKKEKQICETLRERCGRVLAVVAEQGHTHLVLGAFGCGVFKNDPNNVADAFDYWLSGKYAGVFDEVVFAIPFDQNNFPVFSDYFGDNATKTSTSRIADKLQDASSEKNKTKKGQDASSDKNKTKKEQNSVKTQSRKDLRRQKYDVTGDD